MWSRFLCLSLLAGMGMCQDFPVFRGIPPEVQEQLDQEPPFDMDRDIAPVLIARELGDAVRQAVSPFSSDASLVIRHTVLMANSWFDAIAPYHPTAEGIYSSLGRRPAGESVTYRNKNIACFYSSLRVLGNAIPQQRERYRLMLQRVGLDPDDTHESTTDPIGIGNLAGRKINEFRDNDGMNSRGDIGAKSRYNLRPFYDYTKYRPVNSPFEVTDPSRWQPKITDNGAGVYKIQKYVTPQHGLTKAYSFDDVSVFEAKPHGRLLKTQADFATYKKTTDEVVEIQAKLTETQKMAAEFFDDKLRSIGYAVFGVMQTRNLTLDEFVHLEMVTNAAAFDSTIVMWKEKSRWDAVRPFTAIPYLYGDNYITAWGGVGEGTVHDLPASEWKSYMPVADHPEYPSTTAGVCAAHSEASRAWTGDERTHLDPVPFPQGTSRIEFGISPSQNITLAFPTWTDYELTCGSSRLWGGVHFVDAVEEGNRLGNEVGKLVVDFIKRKVYGKDAARIGAPLAHKPIVPQQQQQQGQQGQQGQQQSAPLRQRPGSQRQRERQRQPVGPSVSAEVTPQQLKFLPLRASVPAHTTPTLAHAGTLLRSGAGNYAYTSAHGVSHGTGYPAVAPVAPAAPVTTVAPAYPQTYVQTPYANFFNNFPSFGQK